MTEVVEVVSLSASLVCVLVSAVGVIVSKSALARLHFLAPLTTIAFPVFALAAILRTGWSLGSATILVTVVVLAVAGPVTSAAVGRVLAAEAGADVGRSPE